MVMDFSSLFIMVFMNVFPCRPILSLGEGVCKFFELDLRSGCELLVLHSHLHICFMSLFLFQSEFTVCIHGI